MVSASCGALTIPRKTKWNQFSSISQAQQLMNFPQQRFEYCYLSIRKLYFLRLAGRPARGRLGVVAGIERLPNPSHHDFLQMRPIDIRTEFLTANSCKILDLEATVFRNPAAYPVPNRLRFGFAAEHFGELAHAPGPFDGAAQCFSSEVGIQCLHGVHRISQTVSLVKPFCEHCL